MGELNSSSNKPTPFSQLEDVSQHILMEQCPMLWDKNRPCNFEFIEQYIDSNKSSAELAVSELAERIKKLSFDNDFLQKMQENRSVSEHVYYTFIVLYSLLICFGTLGNVLVVISVLRKPAMKTARNMFIVNLAVSDLLLCVLTSPSTLLEILSRYWPFGPNTEILCKLFGGLQGICVFVSSMSITAIALDRYQMIVYPTRKSLQLMEVCILLVCVWSLALLLASPMFVVRELLHHPIGQTLPGVPESIDYCVENWKINNGRVHYSVFSMVCQYVLPILIVSVAYSRITNKLRYRMRANEARRSTARQDKEQRARRTNALLLSIAVIYGISWIPLNACNLVSDLIHQPGSKMEHMRIVYAVCHMMGMSSACSNPILYGWLNENFRKEFIEIGRGLCSCLPYRSSTRNSDRPETMELRVQSRQIVLRSVEANNKQPLTEQTTVTRQTHPQPV